MPGTIALVQARMGSTRLPGKVLEEIGAWPMIQWVLERLSRAERLDRVAVVTTCLPADDQLCGWLSMRGWPFYRGSELDLLDRYYQAALVANAEFVVRVTSDCPLIDPAVVDQVIDDRNSHGVDYASNFVSKRYPIGVSAEICTFEALRRAWRESTEPHERIHATPYLYLHPDRFSVCDAAAIDEDLSYLRWTVDTSDDLAMIRAMHTVAGDSLYTMGWRETLELVRQNPQLEQMNQHVRQKTLREL